MKWIQSDDLVLGQSWTWQLVDEDNELAMPGQPAQMYINGPGRFDRPQTHAVIQSTMSTSAPVHQDWVGWVVFVDRYNTKTQSSDVHQSRIFEVDLPRLQRRLLDHVLRLDAEWRLERAP